MMQSMLLFVTCLAVYRLPTAVLLDMCYWVNGLAFLHLFVMPKSSTLFAITFACANGPVAVAIIAWRNSLVFHDLEKVTSVFIHIMVRGCIDITGSLQDWCWLQLRTDDGCLHCVVSFLPPCRVFLLRRDCSLLC